MAQEPLGFRCWGFSPQCARTHSGILTSLRSTPEGLTPMVSTGASLLKRTLPYPHALPRKEVRKATLRRAA
jgi:hypothetical protein